MAESIPELKARVSAKTEEEHGGVLPEGYRVWFRRYGTKGAGRWRVRGPYAWVEADSEEYIRREAWWLVACDENGMGG